MKNKLVLIFGLICIAAFQHPESVRAQSKSCDLAIQFSSPHDNDIYAAGDTAKIRFKIINYGPDSISATDTIYLYCSYYPNITYYYPLTPIPAGDSVNTGHVYVAFYNTNNTNDTFTACAYLVSQSATFSDPNPDNDTAGCVSFILKGKDNTGISNQPAGRLNPFTIYPNPAKGSVSIKWALPDNNSLAGIHITNIYGETIWQQQYHQSAGSKGSRNIDVSSLPPGLYFVTFSTGAFKKTQKLVIQ